MLGAIIGDIVGSAYEFNPTNDYNFEMWADGSKFTDDTICTIAIADAILKGRDYGESLHDWCRRYLKPKGGFGGRFRRWVESNNPQPYDSFGNGSAMRVSPVAWAFPTLDDAMREAEKSALCSHNHPEGIKGAVATVMAMLQGREMQRLGVKVDEQTLRTYLQPVLEYSHYDIDIDLGQVMNVFDETCQGTLPVALWVITLSTGYEDAIRRAIALGADADTLGAIVGAIAEMIWGVPTDLRAKALSYLTEEMREVVREFGERYDRSF